MHLLERIGAKDAVPIDLIVFQGITGDVDVTLVLEGDGGERGAGGGGIRSGMTGGTPRFEATRIKVRIDAWCQRMMLLLYLKVVGICETSALLGRAPFTKHSVLEYLKQ